MALFIAGLVFSQESKPLFTGKADDMRVVPSLASRSSLIPQISKEEEMKDGRSSRIDVVIGKDRQTTNDFFTEERNALFQKRRGRTPELVFDAVSSNAQPTDPALAVGPNHVFIVYNTGFRIFDKQGTPLTAQLAETNIFPSGGCCDLTASYDNVADRWVISLLGNGAFIAVSDSPDPVNCNWYVYHYSAVQDYQKVSVWSDGYYMTENTGSYNKVHVFERAKMLLGDANAQIQSFPLPGVASNGFLSPQVFNVSNNNQPAAGNATVVYFQDDAWSGVSVDHLKLWTINVDWANSSNSSVSSATELVTTPFISVFDGGNFSNLAQPNGGSSIDALQAIIMNQAQFRKFSDHNSVVFNFVVDTDASFGKLAGVRWFELRQDADGMPWTIYQEGTYTAPEGKHAWNASMIMDSYGNIGMGYTGMGGTQNTRVSSYYTGRLATDPINTMTVSEQLIAQGVNNISGTRYGDYSKIDIDPSDDKRFWFTNEYMNPTRKNVVGVFQLAPDAQIDTGVIDILNPENGALGASENVTVVLNNYGENAISNIPVKLYVDNALITTETYTGTLNSGETANFTFSQTVDLSVEGSSYLIKSCTEYSGDELADNDCFEKTVTHGYSNDVGISAINSPVSTNQTGNQNVEVVITNYGTAAQSNIPVQYSVNGATPVQGNYAGVVNPGESVTYTFSAPYNFSAYGTYNFLVSTVLANDSVSENNNTEAEIVIANCDYFENNTAQSIGPNAGTITESVINVPSSFELSDVNVTISISHSYLSDVDVKLIGPDNTTVILTSENGEDSNLGYANTTFDDSATTSITEGSPPYNGTYKPQGNLSDFNGLNAQGDWTLNIIDNYNQDGGILNNWSLELCAVLGNEDIEINENSDFVVAEKDQKIYLVRLMKHQGNDKIDLKVYDATGKLLKFNTIRYNGESYEYDLDMSYAKPGTYIVQMGNNAKKIVVK